MKIIFGWISIFIFLTCTLKNYLESYGVFNSLTTKQFLVKFMISKYIMSLRLPYGLLGNGTFAENE
jgi:hypothetical protein